MFENSITQYFNNFVLSQILCLILELIFIKAAFNSHHLIDCYFVRTNIVILNFIPNLLKIFFINFIKRK